MFSQYQVWKNVKQQFDKQDLAGFRIVKEEHRVYFGQVRSHKKSGYGVSVYEDGRMYEGAYLDN